MHSIHIKSLVCSAGASRSGAADFISQIQGRAASFIKKNTVMCIAAVLAAGSAFAVPPDSGYASYFDFRTLTCLFCTLAVICALKNIGFFSYAAERIVCAAGNLRTAVIALVLVTFIGSMLIANDMALLTFLPLGYFVLSSTGNEKYIPFVFIMQNISANLGGMITPFGNPQNLYIYSKYSVPTTEFVGIMAPAFVLSVSLILSCCLFIKPEKLSLRGKSTKAPDRRRTAVYLILFAFSITVVFRVVPYQAGLAIVIAAVLLLDRSALRHVDYPLLFTFFFFFIFSGNLSRIPAVAGILLPLLEKSTLLASVFSCQFISNVPTAILFSGFTADYRSLLIGVNIGGVGTLVSSLASLITLREYSTRYPEGTKKYILLFSVVNFSFLIILTVFSCLTESFFAAR